MTKLCSGLKCTHKIMYKCFFLRVANFTDSFTKLKSTKNLFNMVPTSYVVEFAKLKSKNWKFSTFCKI